MNPRAAVYLVDDDAAVLASIGRLLRSHGIGVKPFDSPRRFLELHDADAPGCVLLDYSMPEISGLDVQRALADRGCERPVVFLTGEADIPVTVQAMKGGAVDLLTKPVDEGALLAAVRRALERDRVSREGRARRADLRRRLATLTAREREVMAHVVAGLLNKQIALELGTVEKTVKVHRARVMDKMGAPSLADLVRMAAELGIEPATGGAR